MTRYPFPHERLDAYNLAREARKLAWQFTQSLPRGFAHEASQINSAAASVVRNTAEGANRFKPAEKVQKFEIAQGEAGEAAAAVVSLMDIGVGDTGLGHQFIHLEGRAAATLTGLIRKHRPR